MSSPIEIIDQVADAFTCAETIAQLGMLKVTGAVCVYAAHIQQMDAQRQSQMPAPSKQSIERVME